MDSDPSISDCGTAVSVSGVSTAGASVAGAPGHRHDSGAEDAVADLSSHIPSLKIAFVDDETANCRLGVRMLTRLGVATQNIIVISDGT